MIRLLLLALVAGIVVYAVHRWRRERREELLARARAAFFLVPRDRPDAGRPSARMRMVMAGGRRLRFQIPESWEDEPATSAFCARASNSRRLRAEVRTLDHPNVSQEALAETFRESPEGRKGQVDLLSGDRVLLKHVRDGAGGVGLTYCWRLAAACPPDRALVAELSFSVPLEAADAITEDDLALLEREIRGSALSEST